MYFPVHGTVYYTWSYRQCIFLYKLGWNPSRIFCRDKLRGSVIFPFVLDLVDTQIILPMTRLTYVLSEHLHFGYIVESNSHNDLTIVPVMSRSANVNCGRFCNFQTIYLYLLFPLPRFYLSTLIRGFVTRLNGESETGCFQVVHALPPGV